MVLAPASVAVGASRMDVLRRLGIVVVAAFLAVGVSAAASPARSSLATSSVVSVGSPVGLIPQNIQQEAAVAIDAHRPNVLAAGAIDTIDWRACPEDLATMFGFCLGFRDFGIGVAGVYFSFDAGHTWIQPAYTGLTSRDCPGSYSCRAHIGPIATLPWYVENDLVTGTDPALAFGPRPVAGRFSWDNGSRLYYATLTGKSSVEFPQVDPFRGFSAIGVSRIDEPTELSVLDKNSWMAPVIATTRTSATTFEDKEQIWADNAATSPFFGNVYICDAEFRDLGGGRGSARTIQVVTSRDGGDTWSMKQVRSAASNRAVGNVQGCSIRTDSNGVVYLFYAHFEHGLPAIGAHSLQKSFDGGQTWTRPQEIFSINDDCYHAEPLLRRCVADGMAGARTDLTAAPSVDIANGAPTGLDATNQIVDAWSDGRFGPDSEATFVSFSKSGGESWSTPVVVSGSGDRPIYSAPAFAPDGSAVYVIYQALTDPWRGADMTSSRGYHGVFRRAPIDAGGAAGPWTTLLSGPPGDIRGSSWVEEFYPEFVGDYVYAAASRTFGVGLWTDASDTAVCPAVQDYRADSFAAGARAVPGAPWPLADCPATFGNTQIMAATNG
jgi:hypothetical protein